MYPELDCCDYVVFDGFYLSIEPLPFDTNYVHLWMMPRIHRFFFQLLFPMVIMPPPPPEKKSSSKKSSYSRSPQNSAATALATDQELDLSSLPLS